MNNDTFLIENDNLEIAQDVCKYIENDTIRARSVANAFAATIAKKYFNETDVDIESGLYKNYKVLEDIEISDIYIRNNYIDVRIYFSNDDLYVPKANFDKEILPLAYMFIKLEEDLSSGTVTGFILPSMVDTSTENNGYYKVDENELISYYDVESMIAEGFVFDIDEDFNSQIYDYLDNSIEDKNYFYRVLLSSKEARELLQKATTASVLYNFVSKSNTDNNTEQEADLTQETNSIEDKKIEQDNADLENSIANMEFDKLEEFNLDEANSFSLEGAETEQENLLEDFSIDDTLENTDFTLNPESSDDLEVLQENLDTTSEEKDDNEDFELLENTDVLDETFESEDSDDTLTIIDNLPENSTDEELEAHFGLSEDNSVENIEDPLNITEDSSFDAIENNDFDFSTSVTPSINSIEDSIAEDNTIEKELNEEEGSSLTLQDDDESQEETNTTEEYAIDTNDVEELVFEETLEPEEVSDDDSTNKNIEELEVLFNDAENTTSEQTTKEEDFEDSTYNETEDSELETDYIPQKNKGIGIVPLIGVVALIATAGYFSYNKFINQQDIDSSLAKPEVATVPHNVKKDTANLPKKETVEAMPIETVEKEVKLENKNEGLAIGIPAIEKNLDASILISNLSIQWEVPAGYATNNTAKRYFTKMGKIIQLNLKTEMLLLNKPPMTNKIIVELEFNKSLNKFNVKGLVASSGESTVDELIKKTVQNALDINLSMNMNIFNNIQGNPSLVIRL